MGQRGEREGLAWASDKPPDTRERRAEPPAGRGVGSPAGPPPSAIGNLPGGIDEGARHLCRLIGLRPAASVLEVGRGAGSFAAALHRLGYRVTALTPSGKGVETPGERHPGPTYVAADLKAPPDGPYDLVLSVSSRFGSFEPAHADLLLRTWQSKLKSGGWLVMAAGGESAGDEVSDSGRSAQFFSTRRLIAMLHAAGFGYVQVCGSFDGAPKRPGGSAIVVAESR